MQEFIVTEVFAGTARVGSTFRHFGMTSCFGVDHLRHRNSCAPISIIDFTTHRGQVLLLQWLENLKLIGLFLAPLCGTASSACKILLSKICRYGPTPVRSDSEPNGISNLLTFVDRIKVSKSNKLYHLTAQLVKIALHRGLIVCVCVDLLKRSKTCTLFDSRGAELFDATLSNEATHQRGKSGLITLMYLLHD